MKSNNSSKGMGSGVDGGGWQGLPLAEMLMLMAVVVMMVLVQVVLKSSKRMASGCWRVASSAPHGAAN